MSLCVIGKLLFLPLEEARRQEWPFLEVKMGMAVLFFSDVDLPLASMQLLHKLWGGENVWMLETVMTFEVMGKCPHV